MDINSILPFIATRLGLNPETLVALIGIIIAVANLLGKTIPSSATGFLGVVRKICLVIGLYVPQQVTSNVSVKNVSEAVAATLPDSVIKNASDRLPSAVQIGTATGDVAGALLDIAKGKSLGHPYVPGESPEPGSTVPDEFRTDGPFQKQKGVK